MSWILKIAAGTCLTLAVAAPCPAQDWPQWRGPDRNGRLATEVDLLTHKQMETVWKTNVGTGFSSIAVVGQGVFTLGNRDDRDILWRLDLATGEETWRFDYAAPLDPNLYEGGPNATPTVIDESVYIVSRRGDAFCLDANTGAVRWQHSPEPTPADRRAGEARNFHDQTLPQSLALNVPSWGITGSPLVRDERVVFNIGAWGVCLHAGAGEVLWRSDNSEEAGYSSPFPIDVDGQPVALLLSGKSLHAVRLETGDVLWRHPWITRYGVNAADPFVVDAQRLIVSSGYSKGTSLVSFDSSGAEEVWRKRAPRNQLTPGVLLDDVLLTTDGDAGGENRLLAMRAADGAVLWDEPGFGLASLIAVNDSLLILSETGELVLAQFTAEGLKILARQQILDGKCWTSPVFAAGSVFARNAAGDLVRVRLH